jgi:hypothetical protein
VRVEAQDRAGIGLHPACGFHRSSCRVCIPARSGTTAVIAGSYAAAFAAGHGRCTGAARHTSAVAGRSTGRRVARRKRSLANADQRIELIANARRPTNNSLKPVVLVVDEFAESEEAGESDYLYVRLRSPSGELLQTSLVLTNLSQ